jgi:hypothetical protein
LPKTKAETKDAIIYLRLTSKIRSQIDNQAAQEAVTTQSGKETSHKRLRERNALQPHLECQLHNKIQNNTPSITKQVHNNIRCTYANKHNV